MADSATFTINSVTGGATTSNTVIGTTVSAGISPGGQGVGVPSGGTTGQILVKNSNTSYDTEWADDPGNVFNVMDYGAVGDGSTNDDTAVASAIAAINAASGGTLFFPTGGNYVLKPVHELSNNTTVVNNGTITLDTSYTNVGSTFKGIFRIGGSSGTDVIQNVNIYGGLAVSDCFSGTTFPSPTFNVNDHKYVCYVHSVSTLINCQIHDYKVTNFGSPVTLEKMGGVSGTPSRNTHIYNIVQETVWVGCQMYCNGYLYQDCSIHDIDTKYCYDDCVAIVGDYGGVGGATGKTERIQVYNIRGEKTGQTGSMVKLDAGSQASGKSPMLDIQVSNIQGYTNGSGESFCSLFNGSSSITETLMWSNLIAQGKWDFGMYAQSNGRGLYIDDFQLEAKYDIHFQGNVAPNVYQEMRISNGTCQSTDASLADHIEGVGVGFSAGTSGQGFQNVAINNVNIRNKSIPINEGSSGLPPGTGVQGTYANYTYNVDLRNSALVDCSFSATNRTIKYYLEGVYQSETPPVLTSALAVVSGGTGVTTSTGSGNNVLSTSPTIVTPTVASLIGSKIYPAADTATAIQIDKADASTVVLNVDTTNARIGVNQVTPLDSFHIKSGNVGGIRIETSSTSAINDFYSAGAWNFSIRSNYSATGFEFLRAANSTSTTAPTTSMAFFDTAGRFGIGLTTLTAVLHLKAGTATASTAPLKMTSGTKLTTAEAGVIEYNGSHLMTNAAALRFPVGGTLFDYFTDAGNGTTVETDLYSSTLAANTFNGNGDKVQANYGGIFVSSGTATRQVKVYFAGTVILDTGALSIPSSASWDIVLTLIRVSSTVVRYTIALQTSGASPYVYNSSGEVTGLTLSNTNILKITGQAAGVGAATNDIVAKLGTVGFAPAA